MSTYVVHTGNKEWSKKPMSLPSGQKVPVSLDDSVDEGEWSLHRDGERIEGPFPITDHSLREIDLLIKKHGKGKVVPIRAEALPQTLSVPASPAPPDRPGQAVDQETGEIVPVGQTDIQRAYLVHAQIMSHGEDYFLHKIAFGEALQEMRDKRLYLALGYSNFDDYCRSELDAGRDWADSEILAVSIMRESADARRQIPNKTQARFLARLSVEQRRAFLEVHSLPEMTTRETDQAVREWQRRAEESERRAQEERARAERLESERTEARRNLVDATRRATNAEQVATQAQARLQELESQKPEPQRIEVPTRDPEDAASIARLERELSDTNRRLTELLQATGGKEAVQKEIAQLREQHRQLQVSLTRYGIRFDDEGLDPQGGDNLIDALSPLFVAVPKSLGDTIRLRRIGIGGECDEDRIRALVPQLHDLATQLKAVLQDRETRAKTLIHTEVS